MKVVKKYFAFMLMLAFFAMLVPVDISAAAKPTFKKEFKNVYENGKAKGQYVYTLKNVTKGQTVKWFVKGKGKSYVKLKYTNREITGKTSANRITINTEEELAAKKAKFQLIAKIYSKDKKLVNTVSTNSVIKVISKEINVVGDTLVQNALSTGKTCNFRAEVFPVNHTDKVKWTAKDQSGADASAYISSKGAFNTNVPGTYTVTATTYNGKKKRKAASKTFVVSDEITNVAQVAVNQVKADFSADISKRFDQTKLSILREDGSSVAIKESVIASDGTLKITVHSNFTDGENYDVKYDTFSKSFKASVGVPASLEILTTTVTVDKPTEILYALLDKNGIDVTTVYAGSVEYTSKLTNGIIDDSQKILMKTVGSSGTIDATFKPQDTKLSPVNGSGTVVCIALTSAEKTNFTITDSTDVPDYAAKSYEDKRKVYIEKTAYAHFRALDVDGDEIKYDSVTYSSSDPDSLIITSAGKITPIQAKTVTIFIAAKINGLEYSYNFDVTVEEAPYFDSIKLDQNTINVSNLNSSEYQKYINVTAMDQFKSDIKLAGETATFVKSASTFGPDISYDATYHRIVVKPSSAVAGIYNYQITISNGSKSASESFTIVVSNVPASGTTTYKLETEESMVDVSINKSTTTADMYTHLYLAKYINDIFAGYTSFSVKSISKDGKYYSSELTSGGESSAKEINNLSKLNLLLRKMTSVSTTTYNCVKAETGTYNIEVSYYNSALSANVTANTTITVTDAETAAFASVERTISTKTCGTALDLAKDCIAVKNGALTDCVVAGETEPGSKVLVASKDQCHIKEISVAASTEISGGIKVNEVKTIEIGKTLTNK